MKKLLALALALTAGLVANATITWQGSPASAISGTSYTITASAGPNYSVDLTITRDGQTFAHGAGHTAVATGSATDNGAQTVYYHARAINVYLPGGTPSIETSTFAVTIVMPNTAPTVDWVQNPGSAAVNESFVIQARANDADGNLASVYVWRETDVFSINGPGTGYESYSDAKPSSLNRAGTVTFAAVAVDSNNVQSAPKLHTVYIYQPNQSPDNSTISSGGVTQINLGQSVTIAGTLHDPDGNLAYHNIYYAAPGDAVWTPILSGTPSDGTNSSLSTSFTPNALHVWQFYTNGNDGFAPGPGATLSVNVIDGTPPSAPDGLSNSPPTGTSFTLSWNASSDNVGVTAYQVFKNGAPVGSPAAGTSLLISDLTPATTYSMTVKARDAAGLWSMPSIQLNVITADTLAPSIPTGLAATAITGNSFTLSWNASTDNVGVAYYQVRRGVTELTSTTTSTSMAITGLAQGAPYLMTVRARDAAGIWSDWSEVKPVTTDDTEPPSVPTGLVGSSPTGTSFILSWSASIDNVGVALYQVRRGSATLSPTTPSTSMAITGLAQGTTYSMTVRAQDAAGRWSDWSAEKLIATADTQVPSVPSGLAPTNVTGTGFTLSWNASSDNVGVTAYEVTKNGAPMSPTTSSTSMAITGLSQGTDYSMTVKARDAAGNWSAPSDVLVVITTDTQAPSVPNGLVSSNLATNGFTLSWNASTDNRGVTAYEVMRDGVALSPTTGTTSMNVTGLSAATSYSMTVRARDAAGLWSLPSSSLPVMTNPAALAAPVITSSTTVTGTVGQPFSYLILATNSPSGYGKSGTLPPGLFFGSLTTVNDTVTSSISYSGSWSYAPQRQGYANYPQTDYSEDVHYTTNNGDFATFSFTGTTIQFLSETYSDEGTVDVYLDGAPAGTVNCYTSARLCRQVVYSKNDLSPGSHTIKVVKTSGSYMLVDGFVFGGNSNEISGTPTSVGSATVTISATNASGAGSASLTITIAAPADTQAPSVPLGLNATSVGTNSFTLNWTASSDNVGVSTYEVRKGTNLPQTVSGTSVTLTGLTTNTNYSMTVRARDAADNPSDWSSALSVTTASANSTTDSDYDGVPDVIELRLGTNPNSVKQDDSTNQTNPKIHRPNP